MNYKEAQIAGYELTEKEAARYAREAQTALNKAKKEINDRLAVLYADYSSSAGTDSIYNWLMKYKRYAALQTDINSIVSKSYKSVSRILTRTGKIAMSNNYYRQLYIMQFSGVDVKFGYIDSSLVEASVTGSVTTWQSMSATAKSTYGDISIWMPQGGTISELISENASSTLRQIRNTINSGLIAGDSYRSIAKNIKEVIGDESTGATYKALRIARTEGNRALNGGSYANACNAAAQGLDITRHWDASLDSHTRPAHAREDGATAKVGEPFTFPQGWTAMFPGTIKTGSSKLDARQNINCRCTTIETVGDFSPTARRGRNPVTGETEVFTYRSYDQWAEQHGLVKNDYGELIKSN